MTRGKAGHYWRRVSTDPFEPVAVVLTSGGTYSVPSGASTLKGWAVGGGGGQQYAGGVAYKTWAIPESPGSVTFSVGGGGSNGSARGVDTTMTFDGTTITGQGGTSPAGGTGSGYSGGDGGANGGAGGYVGSGFVGGDLVFVSGGVGGSGVSSGTPSTGWDRSILRMPAVDVSGLIAAVALAGLKTVEDGDASAPAFGSGAGDDLSVTTKSAGIGGGGVVGNGGRGFFPGGSGAVVLYFT